MEMETEDEITKLKPLLRAIAEEEQTQAGAHLAVELLAAYHFKELSGDEATRVRDHLVRCRECASTLLDLAEFCAPGQEEADRPSTAEYVTAESIQESLFRSEPQVPPSLFQRLSARIFTPRFVYMVEALSLALILGLAAWIVSLKRENLGLIARDAEATREIKETRGQRDEARASSEHIEAQSKKPQLNMPVVDLLSGVARAGGGFGPADVKLSASDTRFALILPGPERKYPDYAIEILDPDGATVIDERGLRPDKDAGVFTISLPRELFRPGIYRVNVYGIGEGKRTRVSGGVARISHER